MYKKSEDKIDTELDVTKLMKTIRDMKTIIKGTLMENSQTKFQVKHAPKNIIDLDESSS